MSIAIPTYSEPFYSIRTALNGNGYVLHFRWNTRESRWYLSIHDAEDIPLKLSIKVLANYQLNKDVPLDGLLIAVSGNNTPPGLDDFGIGKRCELTYYSPADLAEGL